MNNVTLHICQRLHERNIDMSPLELANIASICPVSTAVVLDKSEHKGTNSGDYYSRKDSNGDLTVLIVRNRRPITIMFRRSNQPLKCYNLDVDLIIDIKGHIIDRVN